MKEKLGLWNASFGEIGATLKILEDNGVSLELFANLRSNQQLTKEVAALIVGDVKGVGGVGNSEKILAEKSYRNSEKKIKKILLTKNEFLIDIDYSKSLAEMLSLGNYDREFNQIIEKDNSLLSKIDSKEREKIIIKLFNFHYEFDRKTQKDQILEIMDENGFRCGTLFELIALDQARPELRSKFPIVAFGSFWTIKYGNTSQGVFPYLKTNDKLGDALDGFFPDDRDNSFYYLGVLK